AEALSAALDVPASSTSLAFVAALSALGVSRVAVAASYPRAASDLFLEFLASFGVRTERLRHLDIPSGEAASQVDPSALATFVAESDLPTAEALLVPDTAIRGLSIIASLEERLGKPVLTANQVTMWQALRLAGVGCDQPTYGRLMAY